MDRKAARSSRDGRSPTKANELFFCPEQRVRHSKAVCPHAGSMHRNKSFKAKTQFDFVFPMKTGESIRAFQNEISAVL